MAAVAVFAWGFGNHVSRSNELAHLDPSILSKSIQQVLQPLPSMEGENPGVEKEPQRRDS